MGIVPDSREGKILFYEAHIPLWTTNALAIGLTVPEVAALNTATANARAALVAQTAALDAARAATQNYYEKVRIMHSNPGLGADMIQKIKTRAQVNNDPNVYTLAQIPPPATPGVTPPPGMPFAFTATLVPEGALELKWKCNNPPGTNGTIYEVKRQVEGAGDFAFIGGSGTKSFLDETLPAGPAEVTYKITAVRSTARGTTAVFVVKFGVGGSGLSVASITAGDGMKLAA